MRRKILLTITYVFMFAAISCVLFGCDFSISSDIVDVVDYQQDKYFIYGEEYDKCIDSEEEYEMFIWYNILYQKKDVKFYKNFTSVKSIEDLTRQAINSYPEYSGVNTQSAYTTKVNDKIYIAMSNTTYYLAKDRVESSPIEKRGYTYEDYSVKTMNSGEQTVVVSINGQDDYISTKVPEEANERHFPIDELKTNAVYNSEQLFMTCLYDRKPTFIDRGVAYTIYNNARDILSKINTDDMTDYEKVKNIYDYIIGHNIYNNALISYMGYVDDYSQNTYGNYPDFYLEGILYDLDNQVSVCDGIAKTFVLLCKIEGIDAIKVNGKVMNGSSYGDHAWNKVKIGDNWYTVDITWSDVTFKDNDNLMYEAPTYKYFLISDETLSESSDRQETWPTDSPETVDYEFYKNDKLSYEAESQARLVSSKEDVERLIAIAYARGDGGFEMMLTDEYYDSIDGIEGNETTSWLENGDEKIDVLFITNILGSFESYFFEYNDDEYRIIMESTDDTITYKLYRIIETHFMFETETLFICEFTDEFTLGTETFKFIPAQTLGNAVYYRANVLGNNTADNEKRLSFFQEDSQHLIVWIGKYPLKGPNKVVAVDAEEAA